MFSCKNSQIKNKVLHVEEELEFIIEEQTSITSLGVSDLHYNK